MEKILIWYLLQLKTWCKKPICWIQIIGLVFLAWMTHEVKIPSAGNIQVGLYSVDEEAAGLQEETRKQNSLFEFILYTDKKELEQEVVSGKLECGFELHEDLKKKWDKGEIKNTITYICTPLTTKGYVARETIFAALLRRYNESILERNSDRVFVQTEENNNRLIQSTVNQYVDSNAVFSVDTEFVNCDVKQAKSSAVYPIQGLIGLVIFITMLLCHAGRAKNGMNKPATALDRRNRLLYSFLGNLSVATPGAIMGIIILSVVKESRGIGTELFAMLILLLWSDLFVLILGKWLKNEMMLTGSTVTIVLLNLLLCPIWINLSEYLPVMKIISCIFPVGIYLLL